MMDRNDNLLKLVKRKSWNHRETFLSIDDKDNILSTYKIYGALQKPKDWNAIALKCSNNPNHECFGMSVEAILSKWQSKGKTGADRGIRLDDCITAKLATGQFDKTLISDDINLSKKFDSFEQSYEKFLSKLHSYVGSEIWLNTPNGLSMRCDAMFTINSDSSAFIPDWKNNNNISTSDRWNKLLGPLDNIDDCDLAKYTVQTHLYRYAIEKYYDDIFDEVKTMIMNFTTTETKTWRGLFAYDEKLIEEIVKFSKQSLIKS